MHSIPLQSLQPLFHDATNAQNPLGIEQYDNVETPVVSTIDEEDERNAVPLDLLHIGMYLFFVYYYFCILTLIQLKIIMTLSFLWRRKLMIM